MWAVSPWWFISAGLLLLFIRQRQITAYATETIKLLRQSPPGRACPVPPFFIRGISEGSMKFTLNDRHAADEILALKPYQAENKRTHDLYDRAEHLALVVQRSFPLFIVKTADGAHQLCRANVAGLVSANSPGFTAYFELAYDVVDSVQGENGLERIQAIARVKFPWLGDAEIEVI